MALLTCDNITLSYDSKPIVTNLSFSVSAGEYLCILGENGAGKSTLMKGILGLLKPVSGKIIYGDGLVRNEIGYLPQQSDIQRDFPASVKEVISSGCLNKCGIFPFLSKAQKETVKKNTELLGISSLTNKCYQDLSGGQQQRVLLARALCAAGKLIVLDEPAAGLDPVVTNEFYSLIKTLNIKYNIAVIMVSHDINGAIKNATHILHLEHDDMFYGTVHEYVTGEFSKKFLNVNGGEDE